MNIINNTTNIIMIINIIIIIIIIIVINIIINHKNYNYSKNKNTKNHTLTTKFIWPIGKVDFVCIYWTLIWFPLRAYCQ